MAENKCEELFGKNGELVEFRKKQVLEGALEIVQRHYKDKPNKIEMVARLFGKELSEVFEVYKEDCGFVHVKFTEDELRMVHRNGKIFTRNEIEDYGFSVYLEDLLTGRAVIVDE